MPTNTPTPSPTPTPTAAERATAHLSEIIPWFSNPPDDHHAVTAQRLTNIWIKDKDIGDEVARRPWLADGMNYDEVDTLWALSEIIAKDFELARKAVNLPWLSDDVDDDERSILWKLSFIASKDLELARLTISLPWLNDEIQNNEYLAISSLNSLASKDLELAKTVTSLPWFNDDIEDGEQSAIGYLNSLASKDIGLATMATSFSWLYDSVTSNELQTLWALSNMVLKDLDLARTMVRVPWLGDDVTSDEINILWALSDVTSSDFELPDDVLSLSWEEGYGDRSLDYFLLHSLGVIASHRSNAFAQLTAQPWFADGLTEEEAALVVTLTPIDPESSLYQDLLKARYTQSRTISLPLAGDINMWVFQPDPFPPEEDLLTVIEDTARISEEFLRVPFPTTDIILLIADQNYEAGGLHAWSHMRLSRYDEREIEVPSIPHETAHYYFAAGPTWLVEGGAEFIESYFNDRKSIQSLRDRATDISSIVKRDCVEGLSIENIWHFVHMYGGRKAACEYSMGEEFLLSSYMTIGEEAMSAAIRELYLSQKEYERTESSGQGRRATEEAVYDAFLKHTPDDRKEAFRDLYRRLHGGPYAYQDIRDDHGDITEYATAIVVGEDIQGTLDYVPDFDYFRFQTKKGRKYRISVAHETLPAISLRLYDPDGVLMEDHHLESRELLQSGPEIVWTAPSSDEYYVAVKNFVGDTGVYTLTITPIDD